MLLVTRSVPSWYNVGMVKFVELVLASMRSYRD